MADKKFYDEHGNEIKSRPPKPIYKKWWIWLIVVAVAVVGHFVLGKKDELEAEEPEVEEVEGGDTYTYADFEGLYTQFEGEPYESEFNYILSLDDQYLFELTSDGQHFLGSIAKKTIDGDKLSIERQKLSSDWGGVREDIGTTQLTIQLEENQKSLQYEDERYRNMDVEDLPDHTFYPISEQDLVERGWVTPSQMIEGILEEPTIAYDDFKGTYVGFVGELYESPIEMLSEFADDVFSYGFLEGEAFVYNIVDKKIEGNVLTLDWHMEENELGKSESSGTTQVELGYQDAQKSVRYVNTDYTVYSEQTLLDQYDTLEIDYARILLMTGAISINPEEPVIYVRHSSAGGSISPYSEGSVSYPEDVTHLSSTTMAASSITYSSHGDGHITIYPVPSHYHQEDQSEEGYRQITQQVLDERETVYVDPSQPRYVADMIGRVEFVYE